MRPFTLPSSVPPNFDMNCLTYGCVNLACEDITTEIDLGTFSLYHKISTSYSVNSHLPLIPFFAFLSSNKRLFFNQAFQVKGVHGCFMVLKRKGNLG